MKNMEITFLLIYTLRYDAFLFIDETHALHPLHMQTINDEDFPETFPTRV